MRVEASNGYVYDEYDPLCWITIERCQGADYAFIQVIDSEWPDDTHRYWGKYDFNNKAASIMQIIERGGKWPDLLKERPRQS